MDINFIIFFLFLVLAIYLVSEMELDGMMYLIFGIIFSLIFANTQTATPLFFTNDSYLGAGRFFNIFWLMLGIICYVKSYYAAKDRGIFRGFGK